MNDQEQRTKEQSFIVSAAVIALLLAGCGPLPEHMCAESEYAGTARAMEACAKDKTCVLSGKEAAYIAWHKEHFPECFRGVEK